VHAVEIDPVSAAALRRSIALNPAVGDRIRVVEGEPIRARAEMDEPRGLVGPRGST
jgi:tRNA G37 N-methylase Trm5